MEGIIKNDLTVSEIEKMDFSSVVAITREPNMCSGGIETLRVIIRECNLRRDAKILEIGSNTGFSSIEFACMMPESEVTGIDINPISVEFSKDKANQFGINNVKFIQSNALELPFEDNSFDMIFVSNVTSFINDRENAIVEYTRVLKPGGVLAAAPIYYRQNPPANIISDVEDAILAKIDVWDKQYWDNLFLSFNMKCYYTQDYKYIRSTQEEIDKYVEMVFSQKHLEAYESEIREALRKRLSYFYELFDVNLSYAGYSIMLYRYKSPNDIPILHKTCIA